MRLFEEQRCSLLIFTIYVSSLNIKNRKLLFEFFSFVLLFCIKAFIWFLNVIFFLLEMGNLFVLITIHTYTHTFYVTCTVNLAVIFFMLFLVQLFACYKRTTRVEWLFLLCLKYIKEAKNTQNKKWALNRPLYTAVNKIRYLKSSL